MENKDILKEVEEKLLASNIFLKEDIPDIGKIFYIFKLLYPDYNKINFSNYSTTSPILKSHSNRGRDIIIFSDLIKASLGSNNRSFREFITNLEEGNKIFNKLLEGINCYDELESDSKHTLKMFCQHLYVLYKNTLSGKNNKNFKLSGDIFKDLVNLKNILLADKNNEDLSDRIIKMFCHYAGIDTIDEMKLYIETKINAADMRNRWSANFDMVISDGDFVKGIGKISHLANILQNGCLAKEYLGINATSDCTPLDTDLAMITFKKDIYQAIRNSSAYYYGPIYIILKNDNRFTLTKDRKGKITKGDINKLEVFYSNISGQDHYSLRTGFASSEINYIVTKEDDPRVGLEIALNGFYIPVANMKGKIIFTQEDYDMLRRKMQGLSYYGKKEFLISENLVLEEIVDIYKGLKENNDIINIKKTKVINLLEAGINEMDLDKKAEVIEIDSTSRFTSVFENNNFEFLIVLEEDIMMNEEDLDILKNLFRNYLNVGKCEFTKYGGLKLTDVVIGTEKINVSISFLNKKDRVAYSTEMALEDYLNSIKKQDLLSYDLVRANIIFAKKIFMFSGIYSPNLDDEEKKGSLSDAFIENWILQNGGSFLDATMSFLDNSSDRNFNEFKKSYNLWNFGENIFSKIRHSYPHNNFINSINEETYLKMRSTLELVYREVRNNKIL